MRGKVEEILSPLSLKVRFDTLSETSIVKLQKLRVDKTDTCHITLLRNLLLHQEIEVDAYGRIFFEGLNVADFLLTRGYLLEDYP